MKLILKPYYVPEQEYLALLDKMVGRIKALEGVRAIYQIGSVSTPGISDIDLFVVFEDGVECDRNLLSGLPENERYLFNHSPFAASVSQMRGVSRYTFFHNYRLVWGREDWQPGEPLPDEDVRALQVQTALEYLLKMYINMAVERTFGIIKVRGLLLHIKALLYDLEFLGIESGELHDELIRIVNWRNTWFERHPADGELRAWHQLFFRLLGDFLGEQLEKRRLYLPAAGSVSVGRNLEIAAADHFGYSRKGFALPSMFGGLGKRYTNLQYRFNRFLFRVPMTAVPASEAVAQRHRFLSEVFAYKKQMLPHFLLPGSSLAVFGCS